MLVSRWCVFVFVFMRVYVCVRVHCGHNKCMCVGVHVLECMLERIGACMHVLFLRFYDITLRIIDFGE